MDPLPEELPSCEHKSLHQYFVSALLMDCAKIKQESLSEDAGQTSSWECSCLQAGYKAMILRYGSDPVDLKSVTAAFAAAVLRVSQALGGAGSTLLVQQAYQAAEQVHSLLENHARDERLLQLAKFALGEPVTEQQPCQAQSWQHMLQRCLGVDAAGAPLVETITENRATTTTGEHG